VDELRRLDPERLARAEEWLRNPPPGSRAEAARKYGIDLSLVIEQLRLTPLERLRKLERAANELSAMRGAVRRQAK
jgi:hypothetical protein